MHQCSENAKLGKIVELGGEATCVPKKLESSLRSPETLAPYGKMLAWLVLIIRGVFLLKYHFLAHCTCVYILGRRHQW